MKRIRNCIKNEPTLTSTTLTPISAVNRFGRIKPLSLMYLRRHHQVQMVSFQQNISAEFAKLYIVLPAIQRVVQIVMRTIK